MLAAPRNPPPGVGPGPCISNKGLEDKPALGEWPLRGHHWGAALREVWLGRALPQRLGSYPGSTP